MESSRSRYLVFTLIGLVLLCIAWAGFHSEAIRYVEVRPVDDGAQPYNAVEIARKAGAPLTLIAQRGFRSGQSVRWPVPETVPLHRARSIVLLDAASGRVVDRTDVSGTSLAAGGHAIELETERSLFAGLDYLFRMPLLLLLGSMSLLFLLYVCLVPENEMWRHRRL